MTSSDYTLETLEDGLIKVCIEDRCAFVSSMHLAEAKVKQMQSCDRAIKERLWRCDDC